jgi:hypothetical protein
MDQANRKIEELEKILGHAMRAFRERVAQLTRQRMNIPRVYSMFDDTDQDDAPDALIGARLRPRHPLGGSAIAVPEPDEDLKTVAVGSSRKGF